MIVKIFMKIPKMFICSYILPQVLILLLAIIVQLLFNIQFPNIENTIFYKNYLSILNASGIMGFLFILSINKINFVYILKSYKEMVPTSLDFRIFVNEGSLLTNTLYNFAIYEILIISFAYIFYIFEIRNLFLLILNFCNISIGFLMVICVKQGLEIDLSLREEKK